MSNRKYPTPSVIAGLIRDYISLELDYLISRPYNAMEFINVWIKCPHRTVSTNDEELLIIYNRYINNSDMIVGRGRVMAEELRGEANKHAYLDFLQNLKNKEFLEKIIAYVMAYGDYRHTPAGFRFKSMGI